MTNCTAAGCVSAGATGTSAPGSDQWQPQGPCTAPPSQCTTPDRRRAFRGAQCGTRTAARESAESTAFPQSPLYQRPRVSAAAPAPTGQQQITLRNRLRLASFPGRGGRRPRGAQPHGHHGVRLHVQAQQDDGSKHAHHCQRHTRHARLRSSTTAAARRAGTALSEPAPAPAPAPAAAAHQQRAQAARFTRQPRRCPLLLA